MSKRLHGYVATKLLDGTWRYVHATVDPRPTKWSTDERRAFRVVLDWVPGMSKYKSRSKQLWESNILHSMPPGGGVKDNGEPEVFPLDPSGVAGPHLIRALEQAGPEGKWWRSSRGALERPETIYEALHREETTPPREGWSLVDGFGHAKLFRTERERPATSELEDEQLVSRNAPLARKIAEARSTLARHQRGLALKKTLVKKWQKKVTRLEKRFADAQAPDGNVAAAVKERNW